MYNECVSEKEVFVMSFLWEALKAVVLGIVQGITEWLPISSTGHMILVNEFLHLAGSEVFVNTFLVVIQLGSILAVVILYFRQLWPFYFKSKTPEERKNTWLLWFKILVACVPVGIIGVLFDDQIDQMFYNPLTIAITLILYGIAFLIMESMHIRVTMKTTEDIDFITAANIGLFQILALIPGTSRSGSTILGGTMLGCSRPAVTDFSFFVAVPVMAGASLLKILKSGFAFTLPEWGVMGIGFVVAFLVSIAGINFLRGYVRKHDFKLFGVYRILLGIAVIVYFIVLKK